MNTVKTYTKSERNFYLIGMTGQNIIYNIIGVGLALYYTEALYVPPGVVAILMLVARLWDAFNDFIMGSIVDKTRSKYGKCIPYLRVVPAIIMVGTILAFSANFNYLTKPVLTVVFIYVTYILWGMLYTIGDIPLWGVTALMTESETDRTKLLSLARLAGSIGGAVTLLLYVTVVGLFKNTGKTFYFPNSIAYGYFMATLIYAVIGSALFQFVGLKVKEKIPPTVKDKKERGSVKILFKNKPFMQIMGSGILGSTKMMVASCSSYLILWYYSNGNETNTMFYFAVIGGGYFVGNFLAMYLTPAFLKKVSKKNLYNYSNLLSIIPFMAVFLFFLTNKGRTPNSTIPFVAISIFIAGALQGFPTVLQSSMIADSVDYLEWKVGERADGMCFAGQTFLAKLQSAVAYYGAMMILGIISYDSKAMQEFVAAGGKAYLEYPTIMTAMFAIITVLPAIGALLCVIPTWNYCLDEETHKKILEELNEKRRATDLLSPEAADEYIS